MAAGDLTTLANVRQWLGLSDPATAADGLLEREITAASTAIQTYCNRQFASAAYTEVVDGIGGNRLLFANYPVSAFASLSINDQVVPQSSGFAVPGYVWSPNELFLRGRCFSRGFQNVSFTYTAGFASTPADIEQACIEWISLRYKERNRIGERSKSIGGEVVSFFIGDMPDSVKTVLDARKRIAPL